RDDLVTGVQTCALPILPLGILIAHRPLLNRPVLGAANIIQTIPSLALFGFLLPVPWLGDRAERLAILALTLYALLPVIRGTYTRSEEHTSELQSPAHLV